jgi:HAMP domain-containing protein
MRWKIILPNLLIVLAVGLSGWLYLRHYYNNLFDSQVRHGLERDRNLFIAANQQRAVKFLSTVMARSRSREIEAVFDEWTPEELAAVRQTTAGEPVQEVGEDGAAPVGPTDEELSLIWRRRAHRECDAFRAFLGQDQAGGRFPELIAITDRRGVVISRDVDPNAEPVGHDLTETFPSVARVLQGNAVRDFWYYQSFLLDVAIAPIHNRGNLVGVLLVGYDISNGVAEADRDLFDVNVAYLLRQGDRWNVHSSSVEVGQRRVELQEQISEEQDSINQSMTSRTVSFVTFEVFGEEHIALAGSLSGSDSSVQAGYILLDSVKNVRAPANQSIMVLFFSLAGIVLVVIVGFMLASHFLNPIEAIEEGILRVMDGDLEHRFEVRSSELGGLAYRVNQLVAVLTGEEETQEDESDRPPS